MNDIQLYNQFMSGDNEALEELVKLYNERLMLFVNSYVKDIYIAEDIVSDTFAKILSRRYKFKENAKFKTWLFKIARNKAIDYIRKGSKSLDLLDEDIEDRQNVEKVVLEKEQNIILHNAMKQLKADYKDALHLVYFENMSYRQVGEVMRKSEKQIKNIVYRAKISLKEKLEKENFSYENL